MSGMSVMHVTFTLRKDGTAVRVISARDTSRKEREVYAKGEGTEGLALPVPDQGVADGRCKQIASLSWRRASFNATCVPAQRSHSSAVRIHEATIVRSSSVAERMAYMDSRQGGIQRHGPTPRRESTS